MSQNISLVFPGQGSQHIGMLDGFDENLYKNIILELGQLGNLIIDSIKNNSEELNKTSVTQPALLLTSYVHYLNLKNKFDIQPISVAGHSLGEYSALVCSEVINVIDAIKLVHYRGLCMEESKKGVMFAILGLELDIIEALCDEVRVKTGMIVSPANINSPNQVVIGGNELAVEKCIDMCKKEGAKKTIRLNVSVASHTALMNDASEKFKNKLENIHFQKPKIKIIQNYNGEYVSTIDEIKLNLSKQLTMPVQWIKTMIKIKDENNLMIECGPGKVLSGLAKSNSLDVFLSTSGHNFNEKLEEFL